MSSEDKLDDSPWETFPWGRIVEAFAWASLVAGSTASTGVSVIDLGTGSGAGVVALESLGATQVVGVENGSRLKKSLDNDDSFSNYLMKLKLEFQRSKFFKDLSISDKNALSIVVSASMIT